MRPRSMRSSSFHSPIRQFANSLIPPRPGFTLIELLVVIGIMGLLGTASVGGYRAMQRGMADRGVMDNVNALVRTAYQRAQIDRQPTVVYFWNETVREETEDQTPVAVGKAVAVRRAGRLSAVAGQYLYDEFGDLDLSYATDDAVSDGGEGTGGDDSKKTMYLYPIDTLSQVESSTSLKRSTVAQKVHGDYPDGTPLYLSGNNGVVPKQSDLSAEGLDDFIGDSGLDSDEQGGRIRVYGFKVIDAGGVTWKQGMAYGCEFARLELPHGYIFGSSYRTSVSTPVQEAGTIAFKVGRHSGSQSGIDGSTSLGSRSTIQVYSLRPDTSGNLSAQRVGTSTSPTTGLN